MSDYSPQQDPHQQAMEAYSDCKDLWRETHQRMNEELEFSNPVQPAQWDKDALNLRKDRICLTLDRTNQYIVQIVNDARQSPPGINVLPVAGSADIEVATKLEGIIRHIEYSSRAQIAYDTSIEHAARCGVGWIRVLPEMVRAEDNEQEIRIKRIADPLSVMIDGEEPDGADATTGFVETLMRKTAFEKAYPDAQVSSWESANAQWVQGDDVRIAEYFKIIETKRRLIAVDSPDGQRLNLPEEEYRALAGRLGYSPPIVNEFDSAMRKIKWCKLNGLEVLEETEFPCSMIPLVPVYGFELWVNGKRYLCGATRRLMESQRAYNYERSAFIEAVALQPKAPILVPVDAVEHHDKDWQALNSGSPSYLPWNHVDDQGRPIPRPERLSPPMMPTAFDRGSQLALGDMEAAIGMYRASLGAPSNETSGRAIRERKTEGDTATFHFVDNRNRSIEHLGRIVVDMIPRVYDTQRQMRILGADGKSSEVMVDPTNPNAVQRQGTKVVAINPGVGTYDVRVVAGASYTTQRQDAAEGIAEILQASPALVPILAPALVKMKDWPEAEKISRMILAMAPPEIQAIANEGQEDEQGPDPQQMVLQMQQMGQQMTQMQQALQEAGQAVQAAQAEAEKAKAAAVKAELATQQARLATAEQHLANQVLKAQAELTEQMTAAKEELTAEATKLQEKVCEAHAELTEQAAQLQAAAQTLPAETAILVSVPEME